MAGNILLQYGSSGQTITVTLASLSSGSARASTVVDNTSNVFLDALVSVAVKTSTGSISGQQAVNVYIYGTTDGTNYTEGASGSDAAITLTSPTNALFLGSIACPATSTTYYGGPWSVADKVGNKLPAKWGIIVENQTGVALDSTEGNHIKTYQGIYEQYT